MNAIQPFETVVARHGATVLRVCRAVAGPDDADDAWSDTFLSALRAWPALPADANVEAWLVTIAQRKGIDARRARARRARPVPDLPDPSPTPPTDVDPMGRVADAVAALPERQRLAVTYHHIAGLPHAEVAAILDSTPTAVRKAASDGIRALRAVLANGAPT